MDSNPSRFISSVLVTLVVEPGPGPPLDALIEDRCSEINTKPIIDQTKKEEMTTRDRTTRSEIKGGEYQR